MSERKPAAEHWRELRLGDFIPTSREIATRSVDVNTGLGHARLAVSASGEPKLLLPVSRDSSLPAVDTGDTLRVSDDLLSFGNQLCRFIELTCTDQNLDTVFGEVCDTIINRIDEGAAVVSACEQTLHEFAVLFRQRTVNGPSVEVIQGLVGELLLLRELLEIDPRACQLWTGPDSRRHDFRCGSGAIEVKSIGRVTPGHVSISSLDQLSVPENGSLHLRVYVLEEAPGAELTVGMLARHIEMRAADRQLFRDSLSSIGCQNPDDRGWNRFAFSLERMNDYPVGPDLPRLTRPLLDSCELGAGIVGVSYLIDPSTAAHTRLDRAASHEMLVSFAAGLDTL